MRIVFDESTLAQCDDPSRSTKGVLYFDFGKVSFPAEQWTDFAVIITGRWVSALERLERGVEPEIELRFIDGPYRITLTRQNSDLAVLRCIEDRRDAGVVYEDCVSLADFSAQLRRLARQVASACARGRIESSDVDALRKYLPN